MGLCLSAKYPGAPSYNMSSGSFFRLRRFVASCLSEEFGSHYAHMLHVYGKEETEEYNAATERMLKKLRARAGAVEFLYMSDIKGQLAPSKCQALLETIGKKDTSELFGYAAYPEECMTMKQFKTLLKNCVEQKKYLVWY